MALGKQSTRRVGHHPSSVGVVTVFHHLLTATLRGQPQRLVAQQLVGGKAVVQLHHIYVLRADAGGGIDQISRCAGHVAADQLHHVACLEGAGRVGGHRLRGNLHAVIETVGLRECLGANDGRRRTAGGRTGHQSRQRPHQHG